MEVMVAVQSGTLLHALRVQLKRRVSARRGGDYNELPKAIQKKSRPSAPIPEQLRDPICHFYTHFMIPGL